MCIKRLPVCDEGCSELAWTAGIVDSYKDKLVSVSTNG